MNLDPRSIEELNERLKNTENVLSNLNRAMGTATPRIKKDMSDIGSKIMDMNKDLANQRKTLKSLETAEKLLRRSISSRSQLLDKMGKREKKQIQELMSLGRRDIAEKKRNLKGYIDIRQEALDKEIKAREKMEKASAIKTSKDTKGKGIGRSKTLTEYGYRYTDEFRSAKVRKGVAAPEIAEDITGGIKDLVEPLNPLLKQFKILNTNLMPTGKAFSTGPNLKRRSEDLMGWAGAIGEKRRQAKIAKLGPGASPEQIQKVSGSLGMLGGSLMKLGKVLAVLSKGNLFFVLISLVTTIVKAGNELQKFLVDLNKTFLQMAGPTAGIRDISGSMKEFRQSLFDMGRNLKLGIKSSDIKELFGAISAGGMSLQGVKQQVGSYNKMIYEARVLSLELGTSMSKMGGMITDQMINVRNSLEETSESFRKMAFDASKAGISTEKFWQSIQAATSTLNYFGDFIKSTSALLVSFREGAMLGYRDAEKATKGIVEAFSGINWKKGMKTLLMMGPQATEMFQDIRSRMEKELKSKQGELKTLTLRLTGVTDEGKREEIHKEIGRVTQEISKQEQRLGNLTDALQKAEGGDLSMLATQIGYLAEKPVTAVLGLMRKFGDYFPAQAEILGNILGISEEQLLRLKENIETNTSGFSNFLSNNKETLGKLINKNEITADILKQIVEQRSRGGTTEDLMRSMEKALIESVGLSQKETTDFLSKFDSVIRMGLNEPLVKLIDDLRAGKLGAEFTDNKLFQELIARAMETGTDATVDGLKTQEDRLNELINKTMSGGDYMEIMRESLKSQVAEGLEGKLTTLNMWTAKSVGFLNTIARILTGQNSELDKFINDVKGNALPTARAERSMSNVIKKVTELASSKGVELSDEDARKVLEGQRGIEGLTKHDENVLNKMKGEWRSSKRVSQIGEGMLKKSLEMGVYSIAQEEYEKARQRLRSKETRSPSYEDPALLANQLFYSTKGTTYEKVKAEESVARSKRMVAPYSVGSPLMSTVAPSSSTNISFGNFTFYTSDMDTSEAMKVKEMVADTVKQALKEHDQKQKTAGGNR